MLQFFAARLMICVWFCCSPGWYNGPASGIHKTWSDRAAWVAKNYPGKPFIISETGAGGIVGMHSKNQSRWSEEYQARLHPSTCTL